MTTAMAGLSLVTSLYGGERWLPSYTEAAGGVACELEQHHIPLELIVVVNDAGRTQRHWLARLAERMRDTATSRLHVLEVGRETLYASWNRGLAATPTSTAFGGSGRPLQLLPVREWRQIE